MKNTLIMATDIAFPVSVFPVICCVYDCSVGITDIVQHTNNSKCGCSSFRPSL